MLRVQGSGRGVYGEPAALAVGVDGGDGRVQSQGRGGQYGGELPRLHPPCLTAPPDTLATLRPRGMTARTAARLNDVTVSWTGHGHR